MYDVIVVGGGVVGTLILRELSRYEGKFLLIEKEDDLSMGASGANSGIVHAGYDCVPNTLKAKMNVRGNKLYPELCKSLGVGFKNIGSLVVAGKDGLAGLEELKHRADLNGVPTEIITRKRILEIEPNVADCIEYALWAPTAGVTAPFKLTIAAADYAVYNGAEVKLEESVVKIEKIAEGFRVATKKGSYETRLLINAAGAGAIALNALLGEETPEAVYKKGEYYLLDKTEGANVSTVIFPLPDENGKGILVAPTAAGNVIYGPTSVCCDKEDTSVSPEGLKTIREKVSLCYKAMNLKETIRLYAGVRAIVGEDFVVKEGKNDGYFMLLGICSPGLTAAPALAEHTVDAFVRKKLTLTEKPQKPLPIVPKIAAMSKDELNRKIAENPTWGRVVCRCETISEAEIVEAVHSPVPAATVDAIKRRVRPGMGRCQGGFCTPVVMKIIARELGIPLEKVKKNGEGSEIALGTIQEVSYDEI